MIKPEEINPIKHKVKHHYTLYVRNMVCPRCKSVISDELNKLNLSVLDVRLGEVDLSEEPTSVELKTIQHVLHLNGFELLVDKREELVEKIKIAVIELIRTGEIENLKVNLSDYLSAYTGKDYHHLSSAFSDIEGTTIARYVLLQKIERVKELISYNELTISQIAFQLGYSSVAHLSAQFKSITGITTSDFKKESSKLRKPLDQVS
jgi:AraC family transcriptional regulator